MRLFFKKKTNIITYVVFFSKVFFSVFVNKSEDGSLKSLISEAKAKVSSVYSQKCADKPDKPQFVK